MSGQDLTYFAWYNVGIGDLEFFVHDTYFIVRWPVVIVAAVVLVASGAGLFWMFSNQRSD